MAASIVPGFDFAADAIPTRDELLQTARGLRITNIPVSLFSFTTNFPAVTSTTVASLTEGAAWIDGQGSLWVESRWGRVKVRRYDGGLESVRFSMTTSGFSMNPAVPGHLWSMGIVAAYGSNDSGVIYQAPSAVANPGIYAVNQETVASHFTNQATHARMCIGGATRFYIAPGLINTGAQPRVVVQHRNTQPGQPIFYPHSYNLIPNAHFGDAWELVPPGGNVTAIRGYFNAFGHSIKKTV